MEELIELNWLCDFYGPLITPKRRRVVEMRILEDMTFLEIAQELEMTRQGAYDAYNQARSQLKKYEAELGLVDRYLRVQREIDKCAECLNKIEASPATEGYLSQAKAAIDNIERIEVTGNGV